MMNSSFQQNQQRKVSIQNIMRQKELSREKLLHTHTHTHPNRSPPSLYINKHEVSFHFSNYFPYHSQIHIQSDERLHYFRLPFCKCIVRYCNFSNIYFYCSSMPTDTDLLHYFSVIIQFTNNVPLPLLVNIHPYCNFFFLRERIRFKYLYYSYYYFYFC